jgi:hypothetical protein
MVSLDSKNGKMWRTARTFRTVSLDATQKLGLRGQSIVVVRNFAKVVFSESLFQVRWISQDTSDVELLVPNERKMITPFIPLERSIVQSNGLA